MKFSWIPFAIVLFLGASPFADQAKDSSAAVKKPSPAATATTPGEKKSLAKTSASVASAKPTAKPESLPDTLVITARLTEIPGKLPPNDLYNYVYIMKYRVVKVLKGSYAGQEILVGHYNPLIPRNRINDKMERFVGGDVTRFQTGDMHKLVLIRPMDRVWKDAVEDEYFDSDLEKYYALKADVAK